MAVQVDAIQFNAIPKELAFDPVFGPLIRDLYTKIWQLRNRVGGDTDTVDGHEERITALEAADLLLDSRLDTAEASLITLDTRVDALEAATGTVADSVEYDFGTSPVYDAQFTITDANITASSVVLVTPGGAATGRTADDWQWDGATVGAVPGSGAATCYVTFHPGPIVGRRSFNYTVT